MGDLERARDCFFAAIDHQRQGRLLEAENLYRQAHTLMPERESVAINLAVVLRQLGRIGESQAIGERLVAINPRCADAWLNLAACRQTLGDTRAALAAYVEALRLDETDDAKRGIVACLRNAGESAADDTVRELLVRALSEPWCDPTALAGASLRVIRQDARIAACMARASGAGGEPPTLPGRYDLRALAGDPVLHCLLTGDQVLGREFESLLTAARTALLEATTGEHADDAGDFDSELLAFHCALAGQCFVNEYVFDCSDDEQARVAGLCRQLDAALAAGTAVPAQWLAVVGSYLALGQLTGASGLIERSWPDAIESLLTLQIREPQRENALQASLAVLTPIEDATSMQVRSQYEANPYPRWVRQPRGHPAASLGAHLRQLLADQPDPVADPGDCFDILVAGCGTGRQPIQVAETFPRARILAVDLSRASIAYALRKSIERGLTNLDYAQADILRLGDCGRRFDYIECTGVLHHLADPIAGWQVLCGLLKPGGIMRVALYSESARQVVVEARQLIAARGYSPDPAGIRRCRQDLAADPRFRQLLTFKDFYSTSDCRDLLFHVQEQRFTLPLLAQALSQLNLSFIGFDIRHESMQRYARRFPGDATRTDLARWEVFEQEYPATFVEMYQFYVQMAA